MNTEEKSSEKEEILQKAITEKGYHSTYYVSLRTEALQKEIAELKAENERLKDKAL